MENIQRLMRCCLAVMAVFFIASTASLQAQRTPYGGGDLTININADVPSDVSTIAVVTGTLTLSGTITSFPDFAALEGVSGDLVINGILLPSLRNVFPSLTTVGGNLLIWDNNLLSSITGFDVLETITGGLEIGNSRRVSEFGMPVGNPNLRTISSFSALREVGFVSITRNRSLISLPSFAALTTSRDDFSIVTNANLSIVSGFDALETVGGSFNVINNDALTTLEGFGVLRSIASGLIVRGNDRLSECCALFRAFDGSVTIGGTTSVGGPIDLRNNASGCNSGRKIRNACLSELTIAKDSDIPSNLKDLTRIRGDLTIGGSITEFPKFLYLEVVEGNLTIDNITTAGLTSLDEIFLFLEEVEGDLVITNNAFVQSLSGFRVLTSLGGALRVEDNAGLSLCCGFLPIAEDDVVPGDGITISGNATGCADVDEIADACIRAASLTVNADGDIPDNVDIFQRIRGNLTISGTITDFPVFAALETVEGNITISGITTAALTDIFPVLDSVYGNLTIQNNANLQTISGFELLESVGGDVDIGILGTPNVGNSALTTLPDFSTLATIGGTLRFVLNPNLDALPLFVALTSVGGISIVNNAALTHVLGFAALTSITGELTVQDNAALYGCCDLLRFVNNTVQPSGTTTISGNASGCSSTTAITDACITSLSIAAAADVPSNVSSLLRISGNLTISGDVVTFPDFAALEEVEGDIRINNITTGDLSDLTDIFPSLDSVRGDLLIYDNNILETITGFAELDSIGGDLSLGGSPVSDRPIPLDGNLLLEAIPSFDALKRVGGNLLIGNNVSLTTLSGFGAVTFVGHRLIFENNGELETVDGFGSLTRIGDDFDDFDREGLFIMRNHRLTTVSGFDVLETVTGGIRIGDFQDPSSGNTLLTTLPSFSALTRIGLSLDFVATPLDGFPPFAALTSVGEDVYFQGNTGTSISGFDVLETVGRHVVFANHSQLETVSGFEALKSVRGDFIVADNVVLTSVSGFGALQSVDGFFVPAKKF